MDQRKQILGLTYVWYQMDESCVEAINQKYLKNHLHILMICRST